MWQKAVGAVGGGGKSYVEHNVQLSATDPTYINCGFKPKYIMYNSLEVGTTYFVWIIYDEDVDPTKQHYTYKTTGSGAGWLAIDNTNGDTIIMEIDNTGVKISKSGYGNKQINIYIIG